MKEIKRNFLLNIVYQILILIIPLITIPYVSRILGAEGVGIYSYTYSIVYYFVIFAMLGLNNYGNRTIAKCRDNRELLSKTFKEIYLMQLFTSMCMVFFYLLFVIMFVNKYRLIALIQSLYVVSCVLDINWFFFGIEEFKLTITRNVIIKIASLIAIFLLVKDSSDVWLYTLILASSTLFSHIMLWPFVKKYIDKGKVSIFSIKKHIRPCIMLFLPVIAVTIYKMMDKTMLGALTNINEVGFYESAEKIINVPNAIIAALGTVMLPRMSNIYSKGHNAEANKIIEYSIKLMMFLAFAMFFGIIAISNDFTVLFFGSDFKKTGLVIDFLSITILFLSWGNVLRTQYLIPKEMDNIYIISAFLGAGINFFCNLIFIPMFKSMGACIGTILAEFLVMFYQTFKIRKKLPIKRYVKAIIPFFVNSILMFIIIVGIGVFDINIYLKLILQILFAIIIYCCLNYKYILLVIKRK